MEQSGPHRDPLVSAPDAGAPARTGWLPFHVAILTVVVGLLLVTSAFLIGYGFYAGQRNIALLKSDYLAQVAETGAGGLPGLPEAAANVLRVQRFRIDLQAAADKLAGQTLAESARIRGAGVTDQT
jgi:hypothetical protein